MTSRGVGIYHLKIAPPPPALLTHCHACSDTLAFAHELRKLRQRETFQRVEFEHTVEAVRARVAAVLWQLVVVRRGRGGGGTGAHVLPVDTDVWSWHEQEGEGACCCCTVAAGWPWYAEHDGLP